MKRRTLLIVDDSPAIRKLIRETITTDNLFSHIVEASNGMEALKVFFNSKIDFVITDVVMPKVDGYKFISTIKDSEIGKDVPVVMLSASRKEVIDKIKGLNIGASDYVIKPFDSHELVARVKVFIKLQELQEELKEKNILLEKQAITDELTGLYNRRHFYEHLKMQLSLAKRHGFQIACLLIDIDHFKDINDTYGHDVGDKALKAIAKVMQDRLREGEVLARFGGEEFIIYLNRADVEGAISAGERMRKAIASANFSDDVKNPLTVTISIGVAMYPHEGLKDSDDIIKAADEALYYAKKTVRNKVVLYSESMEVVIHNDINNCVYRASEQSRPRRDPPKVDEE